MILDKVNRLRIENDLLRHIHDILIELSGIHCQLESLNRHSNSQNYRHSRSLQRDLFRAKSEYTRELCRANALLEELHKYRFEDIWYKVVARHSDGTYFSLNSDQQIKFDTLYEFKDPSILPAIPSVPEIRENTNPRPSWQPIYMKNPSKPIRPQLHRKEAITHKKLHTPFVKSFPSLSDLPKLIDRSVCPPMIDFRACFLRSNLESLHDASSVSVGFCVFPSYETACQAINFCKGGEFASLPRVIIETRVGGDFKLSTCPNKRYSFQEILPLRVAEEAPKVNDNPENFIEGWETNFLNATRIFMGPKKYEEQLPTGVCSLSQHFYESQTDSSHFYDKNKRILKILKPNWK